MRKVSNYKTVLQAVMFRYHRTHTHTLHTVIIADYVACTAALFSNSLMQYDRFTCVVHGSAVAQM